MTFVTLGSIGTALLQGNNSFAQALSQLPITLNTADAPYNRETVTKVLAARRGSSSIVPADRDQFQEWLNA